MDKKASSVMQSGVQCNLGYLYMKKNDSTKALEFLNKGLPVLIEAKVAGIIPIVYMAYGEVYLNNNLYDRALGYFEKANNYYISSNDVINKAYSLYNLGITHLKLNNLTKSESYLISSLELYKSINFKDGLEKVNKSLFKLNNSKAKTTEALYYLELSQSYSDSIYKEKSARNISMLKAKMEFEEEKVNLNLQNNQEVAKQTKYIQWTSLGLACMIIISILFFQANKTEKRLNQELALQTTSLSEKQKELNTINKNQDKLFSIVGHDLRGPIVSLKQLLGLALENEEGIQHFYRFGPKLKKDVDHIHFTLDNLLNWGITQMKGEPIYPIKIDIKEKLLEIEELFREVLDKKSIVVNKTITNNLTVIMDANHFNIIFRNLISNAIKFTPHSGKIWLSCFEENDTIIMSVKDNGIGMSEKVTSRIFKSLEHYTTFGTDNERGTGLGLVLCKEMIEKNKGMLTVESELNKGSIFVVSIPTIASG